MNAGWAEFYPFYVRLLPQKPLNSPMCSCIVHMKVARDLVEWAEACPTTHCVSEIASSSANCTSAAPFMGTGLATGWGKPSEMLMGWLTVRLPSVSIGPAKGKGAEHQKLWLTAVGFAHRQQGCSLGVV